MQGRRTTVTLGAIGGSIVFALALSSRGSGSSSQQTTASTTTPTTPASCDFPDPGCSLRQNIATFTRMYEQGGATPAEANCLARIKAPEFVQFMRHAVLPSDSVPENPTEVRCAGSVARLHEVSGFGAWEKHLKDTLLKPKSNGATHP